MGPLAFSGTAGRIAAATLLCLLCAACGAKLVKGVASADVPWDAPMVFHGIELSSTVANAGERRASFNAAMTAALIEHGLHPTPRPPPRGPYTVLAVPARFTENGGSPTLVIIEGRFDVLSADTVLTNAAGRLLAKDSFKQFCDKTDHPVDDNGHPESLSVTCENYFAMTLANRLSRAR